MTKWKGIVASIAAYSMGLVLATGSSSVAQTVLDAASDLPWKASTSGTAPGALNIIGSKDDASAAISAVILDRAGTWTITNDAHIHQKTTSASSVLISSSEGSVYDIVNNGSMINEGGPTINLWNIGGFTLKNYGTIQTLGQANLDPISLVSKTGANASIYNYGIIDASYSNPVESRGLGEFYFYNAAGAEVIARGARYAIHSGQVEKRYIAVNDGTITAANTSAFTASGSNNESTVYIENNGLVSASGFYAGQIDDPLVVPSSTTIFNSKSGVVNTTTGISYRNYYENNPSIGDFTFTNHGSFLTQANGIRLAPNYAAVSGNFSFNNTGEFRSGLNGVVGSAIDVITTGENAAFTLNNSGTLEGYTSAITLTNNNVATPVSITNDAGGTIQNTSSDVAANVISITGGDIEIVNRGKISSASGGAIHTSGASQVTIINEGDIDAATYAIQGVGNNSTNVWLQNGSVKGDIDLGDGDDTLEWTGGTFAGNLFAGLGSDKVLVSSPAYDGTQILDGGDDTSVADGMIDILTLKGVSTTALGSNIINWEIANLDGASLTITDGAWKVGEIAEAETGVFLRNGSTLDGTVALSLESNLSVDGSSSFVGKGDGEGIYTIAGNVTNAGTITTQDGAAGDVLTIAGNYTGEGGKLLIDTVLNGDTSESDRLAVAGDTSGVTNVAVTNVGGVGAQTVEGIKIIEVGGASEGKFSLLGDYTHEGEQAVVGGAYAYKLYQGGVSTPTDGDWYLRSQLKPVDPVDPVDPQPEEPLYQAGVPTYESYAQSLLGLNGVSTLQQRVGNRFWANNGNHVIAQGADPVGTPYAAPEEAGVAIEGNGVWGRIEGAHNSIEPRFSTSRTDYDQNILKLQAGLDGLLLENEGGKLIGGVTVHYAHGKTKTNSVYGDGEISTDGYGFGGTLTWYGENGFYLDGQGQLTWYRSDLSSNLANATLAGGNDGFGYALSVEGGKRIAIDPAWSVTPQAQLVYSSVDFDAFTDTFGSRVSIDRGDSLQGRLGLTLDHESSWQNANGQLDRAHVYGIANLYYEFLEGTKVDVAGVSFASEQDRLWGGLGIGGSYNWNDDKYSIYGEGLVNTSLNNFGDSYSIKGQAGFKVKW